MNGLDLWAAFDGHVLLLGIIAAILFGLADLHHLRDRGWK